MFGSLFGFRQKVDIARMLAQGALILDVRTQAEFNEGHVRDAMNIPLDDLPGQLKRLDKRRLWSAEAPLI